MSLAITAMVEAHIGVHCRDEFVVVHWILRVAEAEFAKLLADGSFAEVENLPAFPLAVSIL